MPSDSQIDHDMLVRLDTKMDIKFDDLKTQIQTIRDDLVAKVKALEVKTESMQKFQDSFGDAQELASWVRDFKSNIKFIIAIGLPVYSAIIIIVANLIFMQLKK